MSAPATPASSFTLPPMLESTADVILKSSDGVQFRAHRSYLAPASTAFESAFMLPQKSSPGPGEDLPVVELSESGIVLGTLLSYIYPGDRTRPETLNILRDTLAAASKYDIKTVIDSMRLCLMWPEFLSTSALAVYDICCLMTFQQEADIVVQKTYDMDEDSLFKGARDLDFVKLLEMRRARARKILYAIRGVIDPGYGPKYTMPWCVTCKKAPPYVTAWLRYSDAALLKKPTTTQIFSMAFLEEIRAASPRCYCVAMAGQWDAVAFNDFKNMVDGKLK